MNFNLRVMGIILFIIAAVLSFVGPFLSDPGKSIAFVLTITYLVLGWIFVLIDRFRR